MVSLYYYAGLGNVLFEYAHARSVSLMHGDIGINIIPGMNFWLHLLALRKNHDWDTIKKNYIFVNSKCGNYLKSFDLPDNVKFLPALIGAVSSFFVGIDVFRNASLAKKLLSESNGDMKLIASLNIKNNSKGLYFQLLEHENRFQYFDEVVSDVKTKLSVGTFMNEKYFAKFSDTIRNELHVKTKPSIHFKKWIDRLQSENSVCIHYRNMAISESATAGAEFGVCGEKYYNNALDYISKKIKDPKFYIFSDIPDWVKENIRFNYDVVIMPRTTEIEDFRLQYSCRHFVISNSTFSWWSSYIGDYQEKLVLAPSKWTTAPGSESFGIYRDDMIRINVD